MASDSKYERVFTVYPPHRLLFSVSVLEMDAVFRLSMVYLWGGLCDRSAGCVGQVPFFLSNTLAFFCIFCVCVFKSVYSQRCVTYLYIYWRVVKAHHHGPFMEPIFVCGPECSTFYPESNPSDCYDSMSFFSLVFCFISVPVSGAMTSHTVVWRRMMA